MSVQHPNRRSFVSGLVAAASAASIGCQPLSPADRHQADVFLERMMMGLSLEDRIGEDWRLSDAFTPRAGAVILNLRHDDGKTVRVDVCRRGEDAYGPVSTEHLDLIVMDGGGGEAVYDDDFLAVLMVLADVLQHNESPYRLSESLLSHPERMKIFPESMACAATELVPTRVLNDLSGASTLI